MQAMIKKAERSSLVLVTNILFSALVLFQFIILFLGRWYDFISFGTNIVFVVGGWMIYANGVSKNKPLSFSGYSCVRAWTMCKIILQGIVILEFIISGIVLIVSGIRYGSGFLTFSGVAGLLFGVAMRVIMLIFFIALFKFIGKAIIQAKRNEQIIVSYKYKIALILLASFEGVKLLVTLGAGYFITSAINNLYYGFEWFFSSGFLASYLKLIRNSFSTGSMIMIFFTSGLSIAICIIGIFVVKKFAHVNK